MDDYLAFCAERGEEPARPFSFDDFEGCVAHFKANPPEGGKVELEFSEEEIQHIREKAAQYECTVDIFLTAVVGCFLTELERRDRLADGGGE
ncbi:MAG: hypothetical protein OJK14_10695 [Achromobacter sp.]|uniref:hypothetical protein n=1 Tax=Achromobacter sp. TaxID=134375 RepID=UPI0025873B8D|nr:hypothetical protein [Achromobacter sp.]MCW0207557.1 hypothetical protein [Achromobacter sp.]